MIREGASVPEYERWFDVYESVFAACGATDGVACPHCGAADLVLRFVETGGSMSSNSVMPALWCATCLHGLAPSRALLPEWANVVPSDDPTIPDYTIVVE